MNNNEKYSLRIILGCCSLFVALSLQGCAALWMFGVPYNFRNHEFHDVIDEASLPDGNSYTIERTIRWKTWEVGDGSGSKIRSVDIRLLKNKSQQQSWVFKDLMDAKISWDSNLQKVEVNFLPSKCYVPQFAPSKIECPQDAQKLDVTFMDTNELLNKKIDNPKAIQALNIKNESDCTRQEGQWISRDSGQHYFCILPTDDQGKACSDVSQCQGTCAIELTNEQRMQIKPGKLLAVGNGACTGWTSDNACYIKGVEVHKGTVGQPIWC